MKFYFSTYYIIYYSSFIRCQNIIILFDGIPYRLLFLFHCIYICNVSCKERLILLIEDAIDNIKQFVYPILQTFYFYNISNHKVLITNIREIHQYFLKFIYSWYWQKM